MLQFYDQAKLSTAKARFEPNTLWKRQTTGWGLHSQWVKVVDLLHVVD
jgi:hypothetical protein